MAWIHVSIGSNIDRERHITAALDALAERFGELSISPVYESEAVGFAGENFLNLVAGFHTSLTLGELSASLREIETANGRTRTEQRFSARTLDIDILTCDHWCGESDGILLPRPEILQNAFVLRPMADLVPEVLHPGTGRSYAELWASYDSPQKLWRIDFQWRGRCISERSVS